MKSGPGAQEKTRTSTSIRTLAPEASASTNSATWAEVPDESRWALAKDKTHNGLEGACQRRGGGKAWKTGAWPGADRMLVHFAACLREALFGKGSTPMISAQFFVRRIRGFQDGYQVFRDGSDRSAGGFPCWQRGVCGRSERHQITVVRLLFRLDRTHATGRL